jgi:hypothetical protein
LAVFAAACAYRKRAPAADAQRFCAAQKNPAFKGSTLYTVFEARLPAPPSRRRRKSSQARQSASTLRRVAQTLARRRCKRTCRSW